MKAKAEFERYVQGKATVKDMIVLIDEASIQIEHGRAGMKMVIQLVDMTQYLIREIEKEEKHGV